MKNVPIKKLIEFRRYSERRKATFVYNLKKPKEKKERSDGGNYWVRSISALSTAFKNDDITILKERLDLLKDDYEATDRKQTKVMYQRNIDILYNFEDYDFSEIRPANNLTFLSKPTDKSIVKINGIPLQVLPNHVFTYGDGDKPSIGGIWFVVWLDGFKIGDLGIYSEAIFRYLSKHYSKEYTINPRDCLVVDALGGKNVDYEQVVNGEIPSLLGLTTDSLRKLI
ncbi:MAG: hypothetical protein MK211_11985 [Flavobacteriales bacterium]|nr:hypothetical protein [Flavobacteriales bacterium]